MENTTTKRSLMNSLAKLENRARVLEESVELSDRVLRKFRNPRIDLEEDEGEHIKGKLEESVPDIIDLMDRVAERLGNATDHINVNLTNLSDLID